MLSSKTYLKILFALLGLVIALAIIYAYWFSKHYPLPVTNRISFDAKIKFIRENIDPSTIDTIIVGSSIGMNDIDGEHLQNTSQQCKNVLNLSVYEASAFQVEQLLWLSDAFPNLERIIYSAQFSDFPYPSVFTDYDPRFLMRYMRHELNPIEYWALMFRSCQNLFFCFNRQKEWHKKHEMNNTFTYLGFDITGSVPLHIYGKDIITGRWSTPHGSTQNPHAYEAVNRMSKRAQEKGIQFYFVQQPYRGPLVKKHKHIQEVMNYFIKNIGAIVTNNSGKFFSLHQKLQLSDKYFADRSHLNDQGNKISADAIGKFIDENEK